MQTWRGYPGGVEWVGGTTHDPPFALRGSPPSFGVEVSYLSHKISSRQAKGEVPETTPADADEGGVEARHPAEPVGRLEGAVGGRAEGKREPDGSSKANRGESGNVEEVGEPVRGVEKIGRNRSQKGSNVVEAKAKLEP